MIKGETWGKINGWRWGIIIRGASFWMGVHWSGYTKRACINLLPCITLWVCRPDGKTPLEH